LALGIVLVFRSFNGDFADDVRVTAGIAQISDSLDIGDIVTYRDVIVGEVTSYTATGRGGADLRLRLHAAQARKIPSNVTAVAVPASLFGNTKIVLMPPAHADPGSLHAGQHVSADLSPAAVGLQTALADAYDLITSVHPADLDAALTALATALQGEGPALGKLVDQAAQYLRSLAPAIPELDTVIAQFATVTTDLARNAPALLGSIANLLTPAQAITDERQAIEQLLAVAPGATDDATSLVRRTGDDFVTIVTNEQPLLRVLAQQPGALAASVQGFHSLADALISTFHGGSSSVNVVISGINSAGLVPVLLGQKTEVVEKLVDPPTYTAAQCPRYPGAGPNCSTAAARTATTYAITTAAGGNVGTAGSPQETAAVRAVASAITGIPPDQIPEATDLLIGSLLRNAATVVSP
jgi:phospholipid/cholesterol/gamma-HCH transport system substrate-binding protein